MDHESRVLFLLGSPRGLESTSHSLGEYLLEQLEDQGLETSRISIYLALRRENGLEDLLANADLADLIILAFPLYIDSLPAPVILVLEEIAKRREYTPRNLKQRFVAICNCGFPESQQTHTALAICRRFSKEAGFEWAGGLGLGGGEAIHGRALKQAGGMARNVRKALDLAAEALAQEKPVPAEAVELMAKPLVPTWIYRLMGDFGWRLESHKYNSHLNDRPYEL